MDVYYRKHYYIELTKFYNENKFMIRIDTIMEVAKVDLDGTRVYLEERGDAYILVKEDYQYIKEKLSLLTEVI